MTYQLIHCARDFATLYVGHQDIAQCADDGAGQSLDAIAMHHD